MRSFSASSGITCMSINDAAGGDGYADDRAVTLVAGDCQLAAALFVSDVYALMWMAVGVQISLGQRAVVFVCAARGLAAASDAFF